MGDGSVEVKKLRVLQQNISSQQFTTSEDIKSIAAAFHDMEITDDCTVNYDEMDCLNTAMVFHYKDGAKLEIWHMKSGGLGEDGLNIRDKNSKYEYAG